MLSLRAVDPFVHLSALAGDVGILCRAGMALDDSQQWRFPWLGVEEWAGQSWEPGESRVPGERGGIINPLEIIHLPTKRNLGRQVQTRVCRGTCHNRKEVRRFVGVAEV